MSKYDLVAVVRMRFAALFRPPPYTGGDMCVSGEPAPRCPRCGSYRWVYKGGAQACADCGR